MSQVLPQSRPPLQFLMSEGNFHRSRDNIVIVAGSGVVKPGTVLGKITATGKYAPSPATGSDGSETGAAINLYQVDATSADAAVAAATRDCEVNGKILYFAASVNDDTKKAAKAAQLKTAGIVVR